MVEIIRKGELPRPEDVPEALREAAKAALGITLRSPSPPGFPLLFSADMQLVEPAVVFLHEHAIERAYTAETVRTYTEILYDWFDSLEQSGVAWSDVDATDLIAYRDRMLKQPSPHTGRPYSIRTINHRVRGVIRFYSWAVRAGWLRSSPLSARADDFRGPRRAFVDPRRRRWQAVERSVFVLRQFEGLPRPLASDQVRELLAELAPPYDLMARWQLYTGLRIGELLQLTLKDVLRQGAKSSSTIEAAYRQIDIVRKGRKPGYIIASRSLLEETAGYVAQYRAGWMKRATRKRGRPVQAALFLNRRGGPVKKNTYQQAIQRTSRTCGFRATPHVLRATFGCWMLARLEHLAKEGEAINPLLIVKILMSHEHIDTTDRYLRAVAADTRVLAEILDTLLEEEISE
ncbi:MAG: tyrosine-type recombinase/integrase [Steroidobacteraceae bacterium]